MSVTRILLALTVVVMLVAVQACDRTITSVETSDKPLSCGDCHDSSNILTGKQTQWAESGHAIGTSYGRGTSAGCAGCHSGNAFAEYVAGMGLDPDELSSGDPDPTRQDCRACHMIHKTYTMGDFALNTVKPVAFYAVAGATFDGGDGNLCVNCHQPRRDAPVAVDGVIKGISEHWGPHHGPQSAMLLGVAGAGVAKIVSPHYGAVDNTCVGCHMGEGANHTFEPDEDICAKCHPSAEDFDYKGIQTDVEALVEELGDLLLAAGLINENSEDGHPTVEEAPEDQGIALWNWLYVAHEDKSMGVHNPEYAKALLEEGIMRMSAAAKATP